MIDVALRIRMVSQQRACMRVLCISVSTFDDVSIFWPELLLCSIDHVAAGLGFIPLYRLFWMLIWSFCILRLAR